ncbi:MAG: hypothetical protein WBO48_05890, partial [Candidatus Promineifilaceae bacterium]
MNGRSPLFFTFISLLLILVACQQAEIVYPTPIMPAALANYTPPPVNAAPPTPPITPLATNDPAALGPANTLP